MWLQESYLFLRACAERAPIAGLQIEWVSRIMRHVPQSLQSGLDSDVLQLHAEINQLFNTSTRKALGRLLSRQTVHRQRSHKTFTDKNCSQTKCSQTKISRTKCSLTKMFMTNLSWHKFTNITDSMFTDKIFMIKRLLLYFSYGYQVKMSPVRMYRSTFIMITRILTQNQSW